MADGFGNLIRSARNDLGMTQQDLAMAVGLSTKGVAKIEREDVSPSLANFLNIVRFLKIPSLALAAIFDDHKNADRRTLESEIAVAAAQLTEDGQRLALAQLGLLLEHFRRPD